MGQRRELAEDRVRDIGQGKGETPRVTPNRAKTIRYQTLLLIFREKKRLTIEEEADRDERDTATSLSLLSLTTAKEIKDLSTPATHKKSKFIARPKMKCRKRHIDYRELDICSDSRYFYFIGSCFSIKSHSA